MNNQRNLILAVVLSAVLLFGWDFAMSRLYPQPEGPTEPVTQQQADTPGERVDGAVPPTTTRTREGGLLDPAVMRSSAATGLLAGQQPASAGAAERGQLVNCRSSPRFPQSGHHRRAGSHRCLR